MRRANGFGTVIKLSGKRRKPYAARVTIGWTIEGKQITKYVGYYTTKREAVKALEAFNTNPYDLTNKNYTTQEVFDMWYAQHKLTYNTVKTYKSAFKKCTIIFKKPFKEVKSLDLEECMALQTPTMRKPFKNLMSAMYKYALKHEIVDKNLAELIEYESVKTKEVKKLYTKEQIQLLWNNLDNHYFADIPIILLYTGMRINELLFMKVEDVHLEERYMIGGLKSESGIDRIIPIHEKIVPLIEKRLAQGRKYLITNKNGTMVNDGTLRNHNWKLIVNEVVGEKHIPHETRHTFITHLQRCGVSKTTVQKITGHKSNDVTSDVYTHMENEELIDAVNKLEY